MIKVRPYCPPQNAGVLGGGPKRVDAPQSGDERSAPFGKHSAEIEAFTRSELKCAEVPIEYRQRVGDVKLSSWKDGWRNMSFLFKKRFGLAEPES